MSEVGKIVRSILLSQATNAKTDGIVFALKSVKTYLSPNVHVHNNILDNINLAHVAN